MPLIDSHVHVTPPDIIANWQKYAKKEPYFALLAQSKVNKFATAEDVIAMLENNGFDMAVIFGFAFCDIGLCRYVNDYVIEKTKEFSGKLIGFSVVPPGGKTAGEIERCHDAGLKGVGELFPAGQKINLEDKKQTSSITGICKERGIPLLFHANELVGHNYPGKTDVTMKQLETFVTNNPSLEIILAHWGGGIFLYETMPEIKEKFRKVYYDTSITPFLYDERIYRAAKALGLCEKILFGSDFPILPPSRYMDGIEKSGLSDDEKKMLLGGNASIFLKINN
jgi:hypothetical protein